MTTTERLTRPTDIAGLVAFRVIFGLLVAISSARFFVYGWIDRFFIAPTNAFKYWGLSWVQVWPAWGMHAHIAAVGVLGLCVAAGVFYRFTAPLLFLAFTYWMLMDASLYLNHYYLVSLLAFLLCWLPLGRAGSWDARRHPATALRSFPAWCTYVLRFQIGVVYVFAGLAKLSSDWLVDAQPLNIWLQSRANMPVVGELFTHWSFALALSWAGFLFDLTVAGWLSWRRSRPYAYAVLVVFHTFTWQLFNIGMFPMIMTACALVFFPPSWPRRWFGPARSAATSERETHRLSRASIAVLALYGLVQLVVPLRHWLYPGDVRWTEEGMRWAWNVKVHEKNGAVTFYVTEADGRRRIVRPSRYLADYQEREMSGQPELILQLAHTIRDDFDRRGKGPVQVRAEAVVSYNGRPSAQLIDPTVDLAQVESDWRPARWILPAPTRRPRHLGARPQ